MTDITEKAIDTTTEGCESMQSFFNEGSLLTKACNETGLDYDAVRRNLKGDASKIRVMYAVILIKWMNMWNEAEAERKTLEQYVPEGLKA